MKSKSEKNDPDQESTGPERTKRRYEKPKLIDYGPVSKLTQTGGITTPDTRTRKAPCL